jgi:hypothetical protein
MPTLSSSCSECKSSIHPLVTPSLLVVSCLTSSLGIEKILPGYCGLFPSVCQFSVDLVTGPTTFMNETREPYYLHYEPNPTSVKNMAHWAQVRGSSASTSVFLLQLAYFLHATDGLARICATIPSQCSTTVRVATLLTTIKRRLRLMTLVSSPRMLLLVSLQVPSLTLRPPERSRCACSQAAKITWPILPTWPHCSPSCRCLRW